MFLESSEQFERKSEGEQRRDDQHDDRGLLAAFLRHGAVRVHQQVANTGAEVQQESPCQNEHDELDDDVGEETLEDFEAEFGSEALIEEVQQERKKDEKQPTAQAMQDRHAPR